MSASRHLAVRPAVIAMSALVLCGAALTRSSPQCTPPGNVWTSVETAAVVLILIGACVGGWRGLRWYESFFVAAIGASAFDVWLPDSRDWIGIGWGGPPLEWYVRNYVVFILVIGAACAALTEATRAIHQYIMRRAQPPFGECPVCHYDTRGLPGPRCPECGTRLDPRAVPEVRREQ